MLVRKPHGLAVTARQRLCLAARSVAVNRSNGMHHVFCREPPAGRNHRLPRRKPPDLAHNLAALLEDRGPAGAMNGAIDSAAAQKR